MGDLYMLIAKQNNQLIDLRKVSSTDFSRLKLASNYACPYCGASVILKQGPKRRAHFSHKTSCDYKGHDHESEAHHLSKLVLEEWLSNQGVRTIKVEYRLAAINRIADIYFEYENEKYVLEIQKSMIDASLFHQRTNDYEKLGIRVIWIFIGPIQAREKTYLLNRVMRLQKQNRLIHFNVLTETFTLFDHLVWINQKEVQGMTQTVLLKHFSLASLLLPNTQYEQRQLNDWLVIKQEFRLKKALSYQRSERGLLRLCAPF